MTEKLVNILINKKLHISFAESLTGGLCASRVVSIPDASKVLSESYVTYSNEAKMKILGVKEETINEYSVVSSEVAYEMAKGLHDISKSDLCVSLTGLAGPLGDDLHEVGTVFIGVYYKNNIVTKECHFGNIGRNNVREKASDVAINLAYEVINNA